LGGITAFSFLLVDSSAGLYFVVFLQALAFGLYTPAWSAIFSRHLDKKNYAFDWSLDNTVIGLALGITAFLGAALADVFGFEAIFVVTGVLSFISALILIFVPDLILPEVKSESAIIQDHKPANIGK
jgi:MFS family permease